MSGITPKLSFKRAANLVEDQADAPPITRPKIHSDLINELQKKYSLLKKGQSDYNLLSRIELLYKEITASNKEGNASRSLCSRILSWIFPTKEDKINSLYAKALNHHGLVIRKGILEDREFGGGLHSAAYWAASKGEIDRLQFLLSAGRTPDQEYLNSLVCEASQSGQLDCLRFLLSDGRTLDRIGLKHSVEHAAENNHLQCLRFLLSESRTLNQQDLTNVLTSAARNGRLEQLIFLLSDGRTVQEVSFYHILVEAVRTEQLESLRFLLQRTTLTQDRLASLLDQAVDQGRLESMKVLLSDGRLFYSEKHLRRIAETAAETGHLECLKFLLSEGRNLNEQQLCWVAAEAASNGKVECLRFVLSEGRILKQDKLRLVAERAAQEGHVECLKFIFLDIEGDSQAHFLFDVSQIAYKNKKEECLKFLDHYLNTIPLILFCSIAERAAELGDLKRLKFLINSGRAISADDLLMLVAKTTLRGHLESLKFLLSDGRTLGKIGFATICETAARSGQLQCLKFLLRSGRSLDRNELFSAASQAAEKGHLQCLQFLLTFGIIGLKDDINPSHLKTKKTEFDFSSIPEDVKIEALLTFLAQSDFSLDEKNAIEVGINKIIDYINHKTPFLGTPPAGSAELNVFYDNIKNMLRFCINQLINEEREFLEARGGVAPAPGSEDYNKYLVILDGKKRILKQMSEASSHCGARWMGEALVLYSMQQPLACDSFDKAILNQLSLLRRDLLNQLIDQENNPDTHFYGAVMQAVGVSLGVPGADLAIESLQSLSAITVYRLITQFTGLYTSEKILDEIKNLFKTNQAFREQAYDWIQSQKIDSKQKDYKDEAVALIKNLNTIASEEIEVDGSNKEHIDLLFGFLEELKKEPGFLKENYLSKSSIKELFEQFLESSAQFKLYFNANLKKEAAFFEGRVGKFVNPQVLRNFFQTLIEEEDKNSQGALLLAIKDVLEGKENSFSTTASQEDIKLKTIRSVLQDQLLSDVAVRSIEEISSPDFIEKISSGLERKRRREFLSEIVQEDGSLSDATWKEILGENKILLLRGL